MTANTQIGTIELTSGRTKLVLDGRTGAIQRIEDTVTGHVHVDATKDGHADARLFQLVAGAGIWWSCPVEGHTQENAVCTQAGDGVRIEFPDLKAADGEQTGIRAEVTIEPSERPDEFVFSMSLENKGSRTIIDTAFPLIGGWQEQSETDRISLGANMIKEPRDLAPSAGNNYARNGRRQAFFYPVFLSAPWVDFTTPQGGLSYVNYMEEAFNGRFWIDNQAGYGDDFRLMFCWSHLTAIGPGESWSSPPMGIALHGTDWRSTASRYSDWFDGLYPPDYSRPAVRSRMGFQNVFFRGFDGTPIRPLERIPEVAKAGRDCGVDMLCVWDTPTLGNYARHDPHDLTDYLPEDRKALAQGLKQAESEGSKTCALTNFRHPNVALHMSDPDIVNRVQKRFTGTFRTENWAANHTFGDLWARHIGPESWVFSPFSPEHRERVVRVTEDYLTLGYTSMFYDQPFEVEPDYGFIDRGHAPYTTHRDALSLVGEVRGQLLAGDPDAIVIGEESDIHGSRYVDQWMSWSIADPSPALIDRLTMMRYAIPHTILSWVVDHQPERAALAFAFGMQLCLMVHGGEGTLAEEPEFGELVGKLAALRRKTADRTVMARFRGQDGLTIDGGDGFLAFAYQSDAGPAVIAVAHGAAAKGTVRVDTNVLGAGASGGTVYGMDGSETPHAGTSCDFALGANEVAVWTL